MTHEDTQTSEVSAVLRGDPGAIDRWYRAQHPLVWRLCLGFLGSSAEAEDVAQEAMLKLHDQLNRWNPALPFRPWRNSLVLNLCRDRIRRRKARNQAEGDAASRRADRDVAAPSAGMEQRELQGLLQRAFVSLSDREREAFVLRELEGLATAEVAESMGVTESSVRSLLTLARRRLRELLGKDLPEFAGEENA